MFKSAIEAGGSVRAIKAENAASVLTRKEIDKLTEQAKGSGAKGMAWIRMTPDGMASSFAKFMTEEELSQISSKADLKQGDVLLVIADANNNHVLSILGALRQTVAKKLDIIPEACSIFFGLRNSRSLRYDEESGEMACNAPPLYRTYGRLP